MDFNDVFDLFQLVTRYDDEDAAEGCPVHPYVLQRAVHTVHTSTHGNCTHLLHMKHIQVHTGT